MSRNICLPLALAVLLGGPAGARAQTRVAPLYSLPPEGTWVEYHWHAAGPEGSGQAGTLRISFVGRKEVRGTPCCWVEIKKEFRDRGSNTCQVRKLLVVGQALSEGRLEPDQVLEGYRDGSPSASKLSAVGVHELIGMGFEGRGATLRVLREDAKVQTGLGTFTARHVLARGKVGGRVLEYEGYLTRSVPFGWARFEIHEQMGKKGPTRTLFVAVAVRVGTGARSELDETKAP